MHYLAEAFVKTFKRDYVSVNPVPDGPTVLEQLVKWFDLVSLLSCWRLDGRQMTLTERRQIQLWYIEPGKPDQNAFVERFNRTYREEVLDAYLFDSIAQVRDLTESWIPQYNEEQPHDSLGRVPPLSSCRGKHTESTLPLCA